MLVRVHNKFEHWVNVNGEELFEMQIFPHCAFFIEFKGWNAPESVSGTTRGTINLQMSGNNYFHSINKALCRITNYYPTLLFGLSG